MGFVKHSVKIEEIIKICQAPRINYDTWYGRHIARKISRYITWLFLQTNITANGVTLLFMIFGVLLCAFFLFGDSRFNLIGIILLNFWYILDHSDGEVARYRNQSSLTGLYLDCMTHYIVHPLVLFSLGFGVFRYTGSINPFLWSVFAGFNLILISVEDQLKNTIVLDKIRKSAVYNTFSVDSDISIGNKSLLNKGFSILHSFCTYPNIIIFLTVVILFDFFFRMNFLVVFIFLLALISAVVWMFKLGFLIMTRKIDLLVQDVNQN